MTSVDLQQIQDKMRIKFHKKWIECRTNFRRSLTLSCNGRNGKILISQAEHLTNIFEVLQGQMRSEDGDETVNEANETIQTKSIGEILHKEMIEDIDIAKSANEIHSLWINTPFIARNFIMRKMYNKHKYLYFIYFLSKISYFFRSHHTK